MLESREDEEGGDGEVQGARHDRGARLRASNPSSSGKRKTGSRHDSTHPAVIAAQLPPPAGMNAPRPALTISSTSYPELVHECTSLRINHRIAVTEGICGIHTLLGSKTSLTIHNKNSCLVMGRLSITYALLRLLLAALLRLLLAALLRLLLAALLRLLLAALLRLLLAAFFLLRHITITIA